jgi:hypothetical protein
MLPLPYRTVAPEGMVMAAVPTSCRATLMMSGAVALRSTSIPLPPCAASCATSSLTPDSAEDTAVPLAVSWPARAPSITNPSRATVASARSAAFCSSVFVGSCVSSQTSRAKCRAKMTE